LVSGRDQNALIGAISKFTGLGQGVSGSLLGMLTPIVMGAISQHQNAVGALDAKGIANLFAGQKDNIAGALPSGFGSLLSGTGLLNSLGDAARTTTAAGSEATRVATSATRAVSQSGQRAAGAAVSSNWLYWLIPIAAAAALLVYFAVRPTEALEKVPQMASQVQIVLLQTCYLFVFYSLFDVRFNTKEAIKQSLKNDGCIQLVTHDSSPRMPEQISVWL